MKRKIIALLMTVFMLFAVVGCTPQEASLYKELQKVATWEGAQTKGNVTVSAEADGKKVNIGLSFTGFSNTKDSQAYVEANVTDFTIGDLKVAKKLSPVKVYVDKQVVYISKSYFTELISLAGDPVPSALSNIKEEYIGLSADQDTKAMKLDQAAAMKLCEKLFAGSKIKIPVTQKGRNYTVALNSNQMTDVTIQFLRQIMNNINEINKISDTGITQKDVNAQKAQFDAMITQYKPSILAAINGSNVKVNYAFTDKSYTEKFDMNIKVSVEGETYAGKISAQSSAVKAAKQAIKFPTSAKVLTSEEFAQLLMAE